MITSDVYTIVKINDTNINQYVFCTQWNYLLRWCRICGCHVGKLSYRLRISYTVEYLEHSRFRRLVEVRICSVNF